MNKVVLLVLDAVQHRRKWEGLIDPEGRLVKYGDEMTLAEKLGASKP